MSKKMGSQYINATFGNVEDEFQLIERVGLAMKRYNVPDNAKDAIKEIIRESVNFGFNLGLEEAKRG